MSEGNGSEGSKVGLLQPTSVSVACDKCGHVTKLIVGAFVGKPEEAPRVVVPKIQVVT